MSMSPEQRHFLRSSLQRERNVGVFCRREFSTYSVVFSGEDELFVFHVVTDTLWLYFTYFNDRTQHDAHLLFLFFLNSLY